MLCSEPAGEVFVDTDGRWPLAESVEEGDQPSQHVLTVAAQIERPTCPTNRRCAVALGFALLRECPGGKGGEVPEPRALRVDPILELGRHSRNEEAVEKIAAIE